MTRVLLIDNDLSRAKTAAALRSDCQCVCDECEDVLPLQAARDALNGVKLAANRSRETLKAEWSGGCVSPEGCDIVLLHTSNDYSKGYFELLLKQHVVVMFSGDKGSSWGNEVNADSVKHKLISREQLREHVCDFVHEYRRDLLPPWEIFEGRGAPSRVRERLFATIALGDTAGENVAQPVFSSDLSEPEYLNLVLTRVFPGEAADLRQRAEAILANDDPVCGRIHRALKGFVQAQAQNHPAIEEFLQLLCTQKRSSKTS